MTWEIRQGDAFARLPEIPDGSIDSIVTSPPYADQRKRSYKGYPWTEAFEWMAQFADELLRIAAPDAGFMLNVGRVIRDGCERPVAEELRRACEAAGWSWIDTIVWHKTNAAPLSSPQYMHGVHEMVWWLGKTPKAYRGYDKDTRTPHAPGSLARMQQGYKHDDSDRYRKRGKTHNAHPDGARPKTIFAGSVGSARGLKHTAPMSLDLARLLVSLSCRPGGMVLDPFCGAATTGVAALERDRRFIGIEMNPESAAEASTRLQGHRQQLALGSA